MTDPFDRAPSPSDDDESLPDEPRPAEDAGLVLVGGEGDEALESVDEAALPELDVLGVPTDGDDEAILDAVDDALPADPIFDGARAEDDDEVLPEDVDPPDAPLELDGVAGDVEALEGLDDVPLDDPDLGPWSDGEDEDVALDDEVSSGGS